MMAWVAYFFLPDNLHYHQSGWWATGANQVNHMLVTQSCPTLCNPMDYSPPGSSVHGILQARTLEWVAIFYSRISSWPKDWTWVSCIAGRFIPSESLGKPKWIKSLGKSIVPNRIPSSHMCVGESPFPLCSWLMNFFFGWHFFFSVCDYIPSVYW